MCKKCVNKFGHLHVHTEDSKLDGLSSSEELVLEAVKHGQSFMAVTDHGTVAGLWQAQEMGDKHGIKIIHGCEFYYERENDGKNGHLVVLAKNNKGLENIFKMHEISYVDNFYKKPRINWEILKEHSEGLIVTSSCLASTYCQYIMDGRADLAKSWARKFKELFGDDFYIELQPNQIMEQWEVNKASVRIAKELGIKMIITNDVHYTYQDDCFPHEVMLAMQTNKKMSDPNRFKFDTEDFWFKSNLEVFETMMSTKSVAEELVIDAMKNTAEIAEKCNARIPKGRYLPKFYNVPEGTTAGEMLKKEAYEGTARRGIFDDDYLKAIDHELKIIDGEGYSDYFLIVQDMVMSAKARGDLVGDGRGSGAGSKVAYSSGITEIPPHEFDLLFERFMAEGREPDFDVDYSDQDAVFRDLQRKYGEGNVARIIAFGTLAPRAVIRKVLSIFEHDMLTIKRYTSSVPDLCKSLEEAERDNPLLEELKTKHPTEWQVIKRLVGKKSHESTHAGGIIIYENLSSVLPVKSNRDDPTKRIVVWDKYMLEAIGHQKFDVLGLATLPVLNDAVNSINRDYGLNIKLTELDREDPKVYEMLRKGDVSGVFQINNQAQKVVEQKPMGFKDLIAINALVRPGVGDWHEYIERRQGKPWNVLPERMAYMEETVGTMTYQEQFLLDAHVLAGWRIADADKWLRKNEDIRNDTETRNKFISDCVSNGIAESDAIDVWSEIEDAVDGGYSFNKSHSASYAQTSYQTAWLKAHYPAHFYASMMSHEKTDGEGQDAISGYISELKQRGIPILPPSINNSTEKFEPVRRDNVDKADGQNRDNARANGKSDEYGIAYRLTTVKSVGDTAYPAILGGRPYASFEDFLERRPTRTIRRDVVENLIKAGAFDEFNTNRGALMWEFHMSLRTKTQIKNGIELPKIPYDDKIKMEWEKEVLGMYLSAHPMEKYGFKPLSSFEDREYCLQGGEVYDRHVFKDKNGNEMAFVQINTLYGNVKLLCFASSWNAEMKNSLSEGNIVLVRGKRSANDMIVNSVEVLQHG